LQREVQYALLEEQKERMEWRRRSARPRQWKQCKAGKAERQQAVDEGLARQQAVEEAGRRGSRQWKRRGGQAAGSGRGGAARQQAVEEGITKKLDAESIVLRLLGTSGVGERPICGAACVRGLKLLVYEASSC
jgi:hypothetical protein